MSLWLAARTEQWGFLTPEVTWAIVSLVALLQTHVRRDPTGGPRRAPPSRARHSLAGPKDRRRDRSGACSEEIAAPVRC
jgi:hypothetical protein